METKGLPYNPGKTDNNQEGKKMINSTTPKTNLFQLETKPPKKNALKTNPTTTAERRRERQQEQGDSQKKRKTPGEIENGGVQSPVTKIQDLSRDKYRLHKRNL